MILVNKYLFTGITPGSGNITPTPALPLHCVQWIQYLFKFGPSSR